MNDYYKAVLERVYPDKIIFHLHTADPEDPELWNYLAYGVLSSDGSVTLEFEESLRFCCGTDILDLGQLFCELGVKHFGWSGRDWWV